jgi:hypothetical protein
MKVAIDYTPAVRQGGGIGRWTRSLVEALLALEEARTTRFVLFYAGGGLTEKQQASLQAEQAKYSAQTGPEV